MTDLYQVPRKPAQAPSKSRSHSSSTEPLVGKRGSMSSSTPIFEDDPDLYEEMRSITPRLGNVSRVGRLCSGEELSSSGGKCKEFEFMFIVR